MTPPCPGTTLRLLSDTVHARWYGEPHPDRPTLIFLHDALGCTAMFKGFPEALCAATGLAGFSYDRPGHGESAPTEMRHDHGYLEKEAVEILPAVLREAGIRDHVLVGHSDGGTIALWYASRRPDFLCGLCTIAPHTFIEDRTVRGILTARARFRDQDSSLRTGLERYHGLKTEALFYRWTETWSRPDIADWTMFSQLDRITAPLLLLQGRDDEYGTPRQVTLPMERVSGSARGLLLPSCGHYPHREQREPTILAIRNFLASLS